MRKLFTILSILVAIALGTLITPNALAISTSLPLSSAAKQSTQANENQHMSWLFVLHAAKGKIEKRNGQLYLLLKGVSEDAVAFNDRPHRQYKSLKTRLLIDNWDKLFTQETGGSPNAIATHAELTTMSGHVLPEGLRLQSPIMRNSTITFKVAYLNQAQHSFVLGQTYTDINLFVDTITNTCLVIGFCSAF